VKAKPPRPPPPALREVMLGWLRRVARSPHRDRLVLRGSLLTSVWCPGRHAADVDHLVLGGFTHAEACALVDELLASPDDTTSFEPSTRTHQVIWPNTPTPGLRTTVMGRTRSSTGTLMQIDMGQGDELALSPARGWFHEAAGTARVMGVNAETMYAWKTDGLFEFGHGSWRAKDLYDLWLIDRHVTLDHAALVVATRAAFRDQGMDLSVADRFLFTERWGASRGSRRRWESFGRKSWLSNDLPPILDAVAAVRRRLLSVFASLGHTRPMTLDALDGSLGDDEEAPGQQAGDERETDE